MIKEVGIPIATINAILVFIRSASKIATRISPKNMFDITTLSLSLILSERFSCMVKSICGFCFEIPAKSFFIFSSATSAFPRSV